MVERRPRAITLDVRMMWSSGIGSYIRYLVPRVIERMPEARFFLMGRPDEISRWPSFAKKIDCIQTASAVFTLGEQVELFRKIPRETDLFWSPHYHFPLLWKGPLLATVHDVFHLAMGKMAGGWHKRLYARAMFNQLVRRADALLAVSRFTGNELVRWTRVSPGKIQVVHNGVDPVWFGAAKSQRPHARPYLLYVGNIKPHKNLRRLLEAFDRLKGSITQDLVLVGKKEGFLTGDAEVLREAGKLADRVLFTGEVQEEILRQYYLHADCLVFPSLYEGFGLPPLEAMACGVPVVVSNAASLPEVCGEAALYFNPLDSGEMAEKILEVLEGKGREARIRKGLEQAAGFNWDRSADETVSVIRRILRESRRD